MVGILDENSALDREVDTIIMNAVNAISHLLAIQQYGSKEMSIVFIIYIFLCKFLSLVSKDFCFRCKSIFGYLLI